MIRFRKCSRRFLPGFSIEENILPREGESFEHTLESCRRFSAFYSQQHLFFYELVWNSHNRADDTYQNCSAASLPQTAGQYAEDAETPAKDEDTPGKIC